MHVVSVYCATTIIAVRVVVRPAVAAVAISQPATTALCFAILTVRVIVVEAAVADVLFLRINPVHVVNRMVYITVIAAMRLYLFRLRFSWLSYVRLIDPFIALLAHGGVPPYMRLAYQ
jgi:hypothetical protein